MIEFDGDRLLWEQVYELLRKRIETGIYPQRTPVPSILKLQEELGVSQGTIRKVVRLLAVDGYVNPIPGRATYVLPFDRWPASDD